MTARSKMLLFTALGIAALAVGCGGGDDGDGSSTTVTTSSLSKPQFVKQADAICEQGRARFIKSISAEPPYTETIKVVIVPIYEEIIARISGLGAPKGDAAAVEAYLSEMQKGADTLEAESASFKSLPELETPLEKSAKLARAYGIRLCAFAF